MKIKNSVQTTGQIVALIFLVALSFVGLAQGPILKKEQTLSDASQHKPAPENKLAAWLNLADLIDTACANIYPPLTTDECVARIKRGVGSSFDPHSRFLTKEEYDDLRRGVAQNYVGIGIEVTKQDGASGFIIIRRVNKDSPADRAGLDAGDVITHVFRKKDGREEEISTSLLSSTEVVKYIRGEEGTVVHIRVLRKELDEPMDVLMVRRSVAMTQVESALIHHEGKVYAYIANKRFIEGNKDAMKNAYLALEKEAGGRRKISGLIISLENNLGGLLDEVYNGVGLFLDEPVIVLERTARGIRPYSPAPQKASKRHGDITKNLPILVVVNGMSASASEIFAGTLKHFGRAVIAGTSPTYGKGVVQTVIELPRGEALVTTTSEYLIGHEKDWVPVQCVGVTPDIEFVYEDIRMPRIVRECALANHVKSGGPMTFPPLRRKLIDVNPEYKVRAETMLTAYKAYILPKLRVAQKEAEK